MILYALGFTSGVVLTLVAIAVWAMVAAAKLQHQRFERNREQL